MSYYKIQATVAESVGYFEYDPGFALDLRVGKQKDGTYVMSPEMHAVYLTHFDKIVLQVTPDKVAALEAAKDTTKLTSITDAKAQQDLAVKDRNETPK